MTSIRTSSRPAEAARDGARGEGRSAESGGASTRLHSLDALRGLAIVIMLAAGNPFLREHLPAQLKHPGWHGLSFADLFFPLFLFVVGVAMTLSRRAGSPRLVLRRVALLLLIGIALSSFKHRGLYLSGVLQHIAGSYLLAWLVLRASRRMQAVLAAGILAAIWAAFLVLAEGDPWGMRGTAAHAVDGLVFGRFATEGVLQTVTSAVTVIGGAFVGRGIKEHPDPRRLCLWVAGHAVWLVSLALLMALVVPINKRIWTPSFTLLTLGTSCAMFALFIWLIDIRRQRWWVPPFRDLGANPIAIYVGFITLRAMISGYADVVPQIAPFGSGTAGALTYSLAWVLLGWLFAGVLYRRRIFLKI